jgi:hypothetical protein
VPEHLVEKQCAQTTSYPVWPENDAIVKVFCAMAGTQWHAVGTMGGLVWLGLRYEALPTVVRGLRVASADRQDLFWGLQIMEREALSALNSRRSKG